MYLPIQSVDRRSIGLYFMDEIESFKWVVASNEVFIAKGFQLSVCKPVKNNWNMIF